MSRFFRTGPGQYGEGDIFWGISVPDTRKIAKGHSSASLEEIAGLLSDPIHEVRLAALLILVEKYRIAEEAEKDKIFKFYLSHTKMINNWDLVDLSCYQIVGDFLLHHPDQQEKVLSRLSKSKSLWEKRIAIVSTMAFLRQGKLDWTFRLAKTYLGEQHDLMHKASGWLLREAGKRDEKRLRSFLDDYGPNMPRTALRYAIEKLPQTDRLIYMQKTRTKK